ncbi:12336_t:CDS:1 [Racocetra persica]|uniref:12336_t:CDS:1 n=1 Tax=Racocetra persica TaxID=160502 RepID=A0ACA9PM32_9GLOM|nr:12336_t:CDS:1 [Racocetra persica]
MPFQLKFSIYDACKIAESRGGQCLSDNYINCNTPLRWKCVKGHKWTANFHSIKNGKTWCSICSDTRLNISIAKELAHSKNGECLSEEYINNRSPLLWRCGKGHEWTANLISIKHKKTWCPGCRRVKPLNLEIAKQIARDRNGKCLSTEYKNSNVLMQWQCNMGYKWNATLSSIKAGRWCLHCADSIPHTLEIAKQIAHSRNGKCLSNEYKNLETDLIWSCAEGHEWYAPLSRIKNQGAWCPYCSKYKRENLCREIVSKYLGPPSKIRQPEFLKTPEHPSGLHLDIYYPEYGFAIEVQGEQHKHYIEFFHRGDPNNFIKQQERDQLKKELCEENWIVLRYVWYYEDPYVIIPENLRELGLIE